MTTIEGVAVLMSLDHDTFESRIRTMYMYNIVFPTIMGMGFIGNVTLILVILKIKDMRNATNIFLANLALADIIFLLAWGSGVFLDVNSDPKFNILRENLCQLLPFTEATVMNVSVLTILAVSFERHFAVSQPLRSEYIWTKQKAFRICIGAWTAAVLLSFLPISFTVHLQMWHSGDEKVTPLCKSRNGAFFSGRYQVLSETVFFLLSMSIVLLVYVLMVKRLKEAMVPSVSNISIREHRYRVIRMFLTITVCFVIFQLPYRAFSLLSSFEALGELLGFYRYNIMSLICRIFLYLHSAINPILYNIMSKKFRQRFKNICCCVRAI